MTLLLSDCGHGLPWLLSCMVWSFCELITGFNTAI